MEVILLEDMEKLGTLGDKIRVARGYAVNYLIPKGKAVQAQDKNLRRHEQERLLRKRRSEKLAGEAARLSEDLEKLSITIPRQAGDDDKLYGSVTVMDVAKELEAKGFTLDRKQIRMEKAIKALGIYTVAVKIHPEVSAQVKVWVIRE